MLDGIPFLRDKMVKKVINLVGHSTEHNENSHSLSLNRIEIHFPPVTRRTFAFCLLCLGVMYYVLAGSFGSVKLMDLSVCRKKN